MRRGDHKLNASFSFQDSRPEPQHPRVPRGHCKRGLRYRCDLSQHDPSGFDRDVAEERDPKLTRSITSTLSGYGVQGLAAARVSSILASKAAASSGRTKRCWTSASTARLRLSA